MKKAIIDIDGVLNEYPQTFIDFCNISLNESFETLSEIKSHLSHSKYEEMKQLYRQSDFKHKAKLTEGANSLFEYLRSNDYLIYIVTSRKLFTDNQLERTVTWLRQNGLDYDYIYCSLKKDFTIFEKFGHIDLVIEDNVDNLNKIKQINGDDCLYFNVMNKDNELIECEHIRVRDLYDVCNILHKK